MSDMRVLYLCYNDATSPLAESQVLPYLVGLAKRGHDIALLSWQHESGPDAARRAAALRERLARLGIRWHTLRYHAKPTLPATMFDILTGVSLVRWLHARHGYDLVHARSYVPAAVAWGLRRMAGVPFIFDMRGMMADEYVEGGNWTARSVPYRLTKRLEQRLLADAAAVVVLTENIAGYLRDLPVCQGKLLVVVPCCVDLERFRPAAALRHHHGPVRLVYAGSLGTWYLLEPMLDFAAAGAFERDVRLLFLNRGEDAVIARAARQRPAMVGRWATLAVPPALVPGYLAGADVGLSFRRATFSQRASSPIKIGEYLACGLPVVSNAGVGDVDALLEGERVGVVVSPPLADASYRAAWQRIEALRAEGPALVERCRAVAERHLALHDGVASYAALYDRLRASQGL